MASPYPGNFRSWFQPGWIPGDTSFVLLILTLYGMAIEPAGIPAGVVMLMGMLAMFFWNDRHESPPTPPNVFQDIPADPIWIAPDPNRRLLHAMGHGLAYSGIYLFGLWTIGSYGWKGFILCLWYWGLLRMFGGDQHRHLLGISGDTVLLYQDEKTTRAPIEQVRSDGRTLVVGTAMTPLSLYPADAVDHHLRPLLDRARTVTTRHIGELWWQRYFVEMFVMLAIVPLMALVFWLWVASEQGAFEGLLTYLPWL